ncbi:hypothetical protein MAPG_08453 [Magnaporthiopsis poae ATCC 64411]|uniref:Uncharacterized protein n=1 Tax=Magnaporthiopsis poae (strain ATCC 64411 / 73-15) TaxID=644358 RepID=A0A0C4E7E0_MAGP6|nr:hypothetical protein MAPG_08453 [Magnaporthiopsis poae ATCC 64411]
MTGCPAGLLAHSGTPTEDSFLLAQLGDDCVEILVDRLSLPQHQGLVPDPTGCPGPSTKAHYTSYPWTLFFRSTSRQVPGTFCAHYVHTLARISATRCRADHLT